MADDGAPRARYGEAFWRAHHEAWKRSDLNQREYCAAQGLSLKAFGNSRAKFKAEPQPPTRKLLWRRGGVSHTLGHSLSHTLSHRTHPSSGSPPEPIVLPARAGDWRRFSEADRRHILAEAAQPGASISAVARRYSIARRVLCRWRQEEAAASPGFVHVEIVAALGADEQSGHDPAAAWRENESGVWLHGNAQGDRWNGRDFYSPDRRAKYTAAHLGRFRGVLQLDGYAGFAALPAGTTALAACWEHARRRFYDVQQATGSPIAAEAFLITH